jgi:hypothetical protein
MFNAKKPAVITGIFCTSGILFMPEMLNMQQMQSTTWLNKFFIHAPSDFLEQHRIIQEGFKSPFRDI